MNLVPIAIVQRNVTSCAAHNYGDHQKRIGIESIGIERSVIYIAGSNEISSMLCSQRQNNLQYTISKSIVNKNGVAKWIIKKRLKNHQNFILTKPQNHQREAGMKMARAVRVSTIGSVNIASWQWKYRYEANSKENGLWKSKWKYIWLSSIIWKAENDNWQQYDVDMREEEKAPDSMKKLRSEAYRESYDQKAMKIEIHARAIIAASVLLTPAACASRNSKDAIMPAEASSIKWYILYETYLIRIMSRSVHMSHVRYLLDRSAMFVTCRVPSAKCSIKKPATSDDPCGGTVMPQNDVWYEMLSWGDRSVWICSNEAIDQQRAKFSCANYRRGGLSSREVDRPISRERNIDVPAPVVRNDQ